MTTRSKIIHVDALCNR